jgi:hypothetical protein
MMFLHLVYLYLTTLLRLPEHSIVHRLPEKMIPSNPSKELEERL